MYSNNLKHKQYPKEKIVFESFGTIGMALTKQENKVDQALTESSETDIAKLL